MNDRVFICVLVCFKMCIFQTVYWCQSKTSFGQMYINVQWARSRFHFLRSVRSVRPPHEHTLLRATTSSARQLSSFDVSAPSVYLCRNLSSSVWRCGRRVTRPAASSSAARSGRLDAHRPAPRLWYVLHQQRRLSGGRDVPAGPLLGPVQLRRGCRVPRAPPPARLPVPRGSRRRPGRALHARRYVGAIGSADMSEQLFVRLS